MNVFAIMLKNLALNYYYSNISINGVAINFNQIFYLIKIKLNIRQIKCNTQDKIHKIKIDKR